MMSLFYPHAPLCGEAETSGGGGASTPPSEAASTPSSAEAATPSSGASEDKPTTTHDLAKDPSDLSDVTLGQNPSATEGVKANEPAPATEVKAAPAEVNYAEEVKIDPTVAGGDIEVDKEAVNVVAPFLKEWNVPLEQANKLVNAFAKYQIDKFRERNQERFNDNKKMHDEAIRTYSKQDFVAINSAIDTYFAPDGVMNYVIRHSELGNDPEFLALMKDLGTRLPANQQPAAGAGTAGTTGQTAGFSGIASAWS